MAWACLLRMRGGVRACVSVVPGCSPTRAGGNGRNGPGPRGPAADPSRTACGRPRTRGQGGRTRGPGDGTGAAAKGGRGRIGRGARKTSCAGGVIRGDGSVPAPTPPVPPRQDIARGDQKHGRMRSDAREVPVGVFGSPCEPSLPKRRPILVRAPGAPPSLPLRAILLGCPLCRPVAPVAARSFNLWLNDRRPRAQVTHRVSPREREGARKGPLRRREGASPKVRHPLLGDRVEREGA